MNVRPLPFTDPDSIHKNRLRRGVMGIVLVSVVIATGGTATASPSIAREWNEEILAAIRIDKPNPPVHARNLFHLAVGMYDAWAAYDSVSTGYLHHERAVVADPVASRREAISYAAYRILRHRYQASANGATTATALDARMTALGFPIENTTTFGGTPAAMGNRIAATVLSWGLGDGSNEAGAYADPLYVNPQPPLIVLMSGVPQGGPVPPGTDPNRWQPLAFDVAFTQNGLEADQVQKYVGVTWLKTRPFALERSDDNQLGSTPAVHRGWARPPTLITSTGSWMCCTAAAG